jgi:hypothetical protein
MIKLSNIENKTNISMLNEELKKYANSGEITALGFFKKTGIDPSWFYKWRKGTLVYKVSDKKTLEIAKALRFEKIQQNT